jgi:Na+/H+ antiporter NhaD/arsenite permease-like protein
VTAALIFASAYAVIAFGRLPFLRIDRTGAAVVGAVLMIATGAIGLDAAIRAVDGRTLVLLFGMMIIVAHLRLSGGVSLLTRSVSAHIRHPALLVVALVFTAGLLSALFVNDTICLALTPIVLDLAAARRLRPLPLLLALATGANIGSVATLVGNPQNMLIGSVSRMPFGAFVRALGPFALLALAIDAALLLLIFRHDVLNRPDAVPARTIRVRTHRALLVKTTLVIAGVMVGFLLGYDSALVAAAGAAVLLVTRRVRPRKVYDAVDWDLLMLFTGLFVIVAAGEAAGVAERLFSFLRPLGIATTGGLTATTAVLSNAVSNVPAVMLMVPLVPDLPEPSRAWLVLAMASTLAGNLTILGSIANLIVVEGARRRGVTIRFWDYARVGIPLSCLTLALGAWWLS